MFDLLESALVLSLALSVMFAVGLDLDFRKLLVSLEFRLPLVRGLAVNLLLIPVFTVGCLAFFKLEVASSIGILLCALCAGGSTGLLFSLHGKGDMTFALALFVILNLISLILVPIYLVFMVNFFQPASSFASPAALLGSALLSIVLFQLLPLITGVVVRGYSLSIASKIYPYSKKLADFSLMTLFIGFILAKGHLVLNMPMSLLMALGVVVVGTLVVSCVFEPPFSTTGKSMLFITLVRNLTLALLVNDRVFGDAQVTLVILTYGLFMYIVCAMLLSIGKGRKSSHSS